MAPINAIKTPGMGARKGAKRKGRSLAKRGVLSEKRIAAERTALLTEKQSMLEGVLDTHDTLVSVGVS
jgi:hypothetical protein